jgi:hypothetical protein
VRSRPSKYDGRTGEELWAARYASPLSGAAGALASAMAFDTSSLNLYVAGTVCTQRTELGNCKDHAYVVLKYGGDGALQWGSHYQEGPTFASFAEAMAVDRSGDIYVTGKGCSTPYEVFEFGGVISGYCEKSDLTTVKLSSNGEMVGTARYHGEGSGGEFRAGAIAVNDRGEVYVTGAGPLSRPFKPDFSP